MSKKLFKAQALAIVMLILVIASIMGVALFSRMAKDKDIAVNEQDSAIALAQVDAMLDYFIGADIGQVEGVLTSAIDNNEYPYEISSLVDLVTFLRDHDVIDEGVEPFSDVWCVSDDSAVKLTISFTDTTEYVEVQPGSVLAFNLDGITFGETGSRTLRVNLKSVAGYSAFLLKRIKDDGSEVTEKKENYCITDSINACSESDYNENIGDANGDTWSSIDYFTDTDGSITYYKDFDLDAESLNNIVEIRILPISGILAFNNVQPEGVENRNFLPIKIAAEATCNVTRGEEMYLPGSGLLGYSTLFDYGIYDNGFFQP
ncbi:MAG: hypothetical protein PHP08_04895 [Candidatus Dojkabacteria bacterium]|nr:hypothetical protein [Candidatus Dojkabacteria bacterium]